MSKFIVIEGSEGVGKSTQINTIKSFMDSHNIEYMVTREPGGTKFGESIRSIILDQKNSTDNLTDSLLFYASRYENYNKLILPSLKKGKTVICDRFHYSTLVYQGIVGESELVKNMHSIFDEVFSQSIDHVIYLHTDPEESLKRISRRPKTDKFESRGLEYLKQLSNAYDSVFSGMKNVVRLDTSGDKEVTQKNLYKILSSIFLQNDQ